MWKELYANIMSCMRAPPASPATLSDPAFTPSHFLLFTLLFDDFFLKLEGPFLAYFFPS